MTERYAGPVADHAVRPGTAHGAGDAATAQSAARRYPAAGVPPRTGVVHVPIGRRQQDRSARAPAPCRWPRAATGSGQAKSWSRTGRLSRTSRFSASIRTGTARRLRRQRRTSRWGCVQSAPSALVDPLIRGPGTSCGSSLEGAWLPCRCLDALEPSAPLSHGGSPHLRVGQLVQPPTVMQAPVAPRDHKRPGPGLRSRRPRRGGANQHAGHAGNPALRAACEVEPLGEVRLARRSGPAPAAASRCPRWLRHRRVDLRPSSGPASPGRRVPRWRREATTCPSHRGRSAPRRRARPLSGAGREGP